MKKYFIFVLVLIMAISFAACNPNKDLTDDPFGLPTDDPPPDEILLVNAVANLPDSDAVDFVWDLLQGYWTATDNMFIAFVYQDGVAGMEYGLWETEWGVFGKLTDASSTGDYKSTLTLFVAGAEASELSDARPEMTVKVYIDLSGLDQDGKINVKVENNGDGDWHTYAYGGKTAQEAYENLYQ